MGGDSLRQRVSPVLWFTGALALVYGVAGLFIEGQLIYGIAGIAVGCLLIGVGVLKNRDFNTSAVTPCRVCGAPLDDRAMLCPKCGAAG